MPQHLSSTSINPDNTISSQCGSGANSIEADGTETCPSGCGNPVSIGNPRSRISRTQVPTPKNIKRRAPGQDNNSNAPVIKRLAPTNPAPPRQAPCGAHSHVTAPGGIPRTKTTCPDQPPVVKLHATRPTVEAVQAPAGRSEQNGSPVNEQLHHSEPKYKEAQTAPADYMITQAPAEEREEAHDVFDRLASAPACLQSVTPSPPAHLPPELVHSLPNRSGNETHRGFGR